MNRTENVSIGRKGFVCEHDAYKVLQAYLDRCQTALIDDPDKQEILADLELSMAGHLSEISGELVVDLSTAEKVIKIMGEVESADAQQETRHETKDDNHHAEETFSDKVANLFKKPLYKDKDREIVDGVCSGIARSVDIDPIWVRLAFIIVTVITQGFGILVYIALLIIMKEDESSKTRSANEVIGSIKERIEQNTSIRPYERALRKIIRFIVRVIGVSMACVLLVVLLAVGIAWSTMIFFMLTNPSKVVLFGQNPSWLDFTAIVSAGFTILLPLFVLIAALVGSKLIKSVRFNLLTWCLWLMAVVISVGALINVVPGVRSRLIRERPTTENVYVEVVDDKLAYTCISLWGDCNEQHPNIVRKDICGVDVQTVSDDGEQFSRLQQRNWRWNTVDFTYPVSETTYCEFIKATANTYEKGTVIFVNRALNEATTETIVDETGKLKKSWGTSYFTRVP